MNGKSALLLLAIVAATAAHEYATECPPEQEQDWAIEHLLRHEDCEKFYKCTFGQPVEYICAAGLHFNLAIWQCDWVHNVDCEGRNVPGEEKEESKEEPAHESSEEPEWVSASEESKEHKESKESKEHKESSEEPEWVSASEESKEHKESKESKEHKESSEEPEWVSASEESKEHKDSKEHKESKESKEHKESSEESASSESVESPVVVDSVEHPESEESVESPIVVDSVEHPESKSSEEKTPKSSEEKHKSSEEKHESEELHESSEEPEDDGAAGPELAENGCPRDQHIHWLLPHECDCGKFYYCVWGELALRRCPAGLHFNPVLQVCDWPANAGCATSTNKHLEGRQAMLKFLS